MSHDRKAEIDELRRRLDELEAQEHADAAILCRRRKTKRKPARRIVLLYLG